MVIPSCQENFPSDIMDPLRQFARSWAVSGYRPRPAQEILKHWTDLIKSWMLDKSLPLFIRKATEGRGQYLEHSSGRILVPVDNSPANWALFLALSNQKPSLHDINFYIDNDQIPIAFALNGVEKKRARLKFTLSAKQNLNKLGWKVAHIDSVGLKDKASITAQPMDLLQKHFFRMMSPSNMFLMPLKLGGLAEIQIVIDEISKSNQESYPEIMSDWR